MEKYLVPDQVGEGDQWQRFKKEFIMLPTPLN